ncbi:MAG TPA: putative lipid II flippase FtsW [Candidatus Babeliales bacterium]|nr:putative lipid II flippase FtsW [Candidatus Babeliales bacterium]
MKLHKKNISSDLFLFMGIITTLIVCGLLFIYSSSSIYALERFGVAHYFLKKQCIGLMIGLCALLVAYCIPVKIIHATTPLLFLSSLLLSALTMIPFLTHRINGSSRWLSLGGFTFQPSELLKVTFIVYVAYLIEKKQYTTHSFMHSYLPFLIILGVTNIILLKQPDFGLAVTLTITTFLLLFIAQYRNKDLLITFASCLPIVAALIYFKPYRLARVLTFLDPWSDPQGSGFQIIQSLIAIGSGGLWGVGISHSKQKFFYLPMQHSDFIFAIIAEETGFIGALLVIILFIALLYLGIRIASYTTNRFAQFTILGFIIMINLQAMINIAVTLGLVPTKGIGLPFISYGNSSLVCTLIMVGLILNMAQDKHKEYK